MLGEKKKHYTIRRGLRNAIAWDGKLRLLRAASR
jgi:hypothetical protein